ncbi:hypothetical protein NQ314_011580 [Rhamnusium bicolor]|uniref:AMP-binding enzyme C-terminal domain-containing protein n=1 Tax=Rhamnusium bicolor TaxID=1586634 RepID=A0AAV8XGY6_9CUCU|nr:hypothetical protein NQ314_011580 [Rhamnusium bicolor]
MDSSNNYDEDGFIKTGDIGYYDEDECFYIIDRIKEMFKYKSWHVIPTSLEVLLQEHPAVKEAVVFGIPHEMDEFHPAACVILKDNMEVSPDVIEKFVSEKVSEWHKLRGGIKIVEFIPKTPSGKILRRKMRDIFMTT